MTGCGRIRNRENWLICIMFNWRMMGVPKGIGKWIRLVLFPLTRINLKVKYALCQIKLVFCWFDEFIGFWCEYFNCYSRWMLQNFHNIPSTMSLQSFQSRRISNTVVSIRRMPSLSLSLYILWRTIQFRCLRYSRTPTNSTRLQKFRVEDLSNWIENQESE